MNFKDYTIIKQLSLGASSVKKYIIEKDNQEYLLRLYDARFMSSRYLAFRNMKVLFDNNVPVPRVYEYGILPDNIHGYAILEWVKGISLEELLVDEESEVFYGKEASLELIKMHSILGIESKNIQEKYMNTILKRISKLKKLGVNFDFELIEEFVYNYSNVLKNCPTSIIHGDYHPGNIVVSNDKQYFIDLDVCQNDFAWNDLSANSCNMDYPLFYTSLIYSYFNGNIPENFWMVYNLYGCLYCLDYILYCTRMYGKEINDGLNKLKKFLDFTNHLTNLQPSWFDDSILRKERKK